MIIISHQVNTYNILTKNSMDTISRVPHRNVSIYFYSFLCPPFSYSNDYRWARSYEIYTVSAYVDANNAFGAKFRQYYTVEIGLPVDQSIDIFYYNIISTDP